MQFDLRFYVVALLFIIFDVEVAFFFPWATVFGKATQLVDENVPGRGQRRGRGQHVGQHAAHPICRSQATRIGCPGCRHPGC